MNKTYRIIMLFFLSIIFISCKDKSFENLAFENIVFNYDGLEKEIVVKNVPEGAKVEYRPNNKYTEVGIYEVEATISMKGYEIKTLTATLEIKANEFENLVFENAVFNYDGLEKEIVVKNVPEGAEVEYRPNNKYTEVGIYEVEATISMKGYVTKVLKATLEIKANEFENLVFENTVFYYDGLEKEILVENIPEGAEVEYRPNNKYTEVGIYEVEATISMKGYVTKVLKATLEIKAEYVNVTFIDELDSKEYKRIVECVKHKSIEPVKENEKAGYKLIYWAYLNELNEYVEYDFNNIVTSDITLYAIYEYDEEQNLPLSIDIKLVYNNILLTEESNIFIGENIFVEIKTYPESSAENVIIIVNDDEIADVEGNIVKTKQSGKLKVYAKSNGSDVVSEIVDVEIKVNNALGIDLNGYNITVQYYYTDCIEEYYPTDRGNINDEIHSLISEIEEKYNCTLTFEKSNVNDRNEIIRRYENNETSGDVYIVDSYTLNKRFGKAVFDVLNPLDRLIEKYNTENNKYIEESTYINGAQYGISIIDKYNVLCSYQGNLCFNYSYLENYNIEDPTKIYLEGNWTYSRFLTWLEHAAEQIGTASPICIREINEFYNDLLEEIGFQYYDVTLNTIKVNTDIQKKAIDFIYKLYNTFDVIGARSMSLGGFMVAGELTTSDLVKPLGFVPYPVPDGMKSNEVYVYRKMKDMCVFPIRTDKTFDMNYNFENVYAVFSEYLRGINRLYEDMDYVLEKNKKSIESDSSSRELGESSKELLTKLPHIKYIYEDSEASYFLDRCIYKVYAYIDVCDNSESLFEIFKERANELKDEHNINVY